MDCLIFEFQISTSVHLARLEGLEPPTYWFVASHSIQLSYKRIFDCRNIIPHSRIKCKSPLGKISIPS